jgi:N-acyl-L-homoserine lactone synthetase
MVTMANALGVRALATVVDNHHLARCGWTLTLIGHPSCHDTAHHLLLSAGKAPSLCWKMGWRLLSGTSRGRAWNMNSKRDLRLDYLARMRASSSSSKHSINLNRMLQEC